MSGTEKLKLWLAAIIVLVAIYVIGYAELAPGVRFGVAAVSFAAAASLVVFSQPGRTFSYFVRDAGNELRKVVWPNKQEVMQMTGIVFVFLTIVTVLLWLMDLVVGILLEQLVR